MLPRPFLEHSVLHGLQTGPDLSELLAGFDLAYLTHVRSHGCVVKAGDASKPVPPLCSYSLPDIEGVNIARPQVAVVLCGRLSVIGLWLQTQGQHGLGKFVWRLIASIWLWNVELAARLQACELG